MPKPRGGRSGSNRWRCAEVQAEGWPLLWSVFVLRYSLGVEEDVGLSAAHLLHRAHVEFGVVTVNPEACRSRRITRETPSTRKQRPQLTPGCTGESRCASGSLTSFRVVAVGGVVAGTEAFPVMHHHRRQVVEEVLGARRAGAVGTGAGRREFGGWGVPAAVRLHVEALVEADVHADLLPVVPPRPPLNQSQRFAITCVVGPWIR